MGCGGQNTLKCWRQKVGSLTPEVHSLLFFFKYIQYCMEVEQLRKEGKKNNKKQIKKSTSFPLPLSLFVYLSQVRQAWKSPQEE